MNQKLLALGLIAGMALVGCGQYSDPLKKYPNLKNDKKPSDVAPTLNLIGLENASFKYGETQSFQFEVVDMNGNENQSPEIDCHLGTTESENYDFGGNLFETKRESLRNGRWIFSYTLDTTAAPTVFGPKSKSGFGEANCFAISGTTGLTSNTRQVKVSVTLVSQPKKNTIKESKP